MRRIAPLLATIAIMLGVASGAASMVGVRDVGMAANGCKATKCATATPTATATPAPTATATATPTVTPVAHEERWYCPTTCTITIQPVALTAAHEQAVREAAAEWNDTGYVRFLVAPSIADDPNTTDPPVLPYGWVSIQYEPSVALGVEADNFDAQGYLGVNPRIWMNPEAFYFARIAAHELGHVLGLNWGHWDTAQVPFIMSNWTLLCPTQYDIDTLVLRYPQGTGTLINPSSYPYPLGAVCN